MKSLRNGFLLLIIACTALSVRNLLAVYADSDIFWHLKAGLDIVRYGHFPFPDPYTFQAQNRVWINHEWLAEIIFASFYSIFGDFGLLLLRSSLLFSILLLMGSQLEFSLATLLLLWFSSECLAQFFTVQPALFSAFFFTYLLTVAWRKDLPKFWVWTLPPMFALWANIHGGFVLGLLIVAASYQSFWKTPLLLLIPSSTLLTPYGFNLYVYISNELLSSHAHNGFWLPMTARQSILPLSFCAPTLFFLSKKVLSYEKIVRALLILALTLASLRSQRMFPFLMITSVIQSAPIFRIQTKKIFVLFGLILILLTSSMTVWYRFSLYGLHLRLDEKRYPIQGAYYLATHYDGGNIALPFDWGGYIISELSPRFKVSVDGRHIALYSAEAMRRNVDGFRDGDLDLFLQDLKPDFLLIPSLSKLALKAKASPVWKMTHQDSVSTLFEKL